MQITDLKGRDHRSLLLYVEDRCVNHNGCLDLRNLRVNENTHPMMKVRMNGNDWDNSQGTRLDDGKVLNDHDDIDCLDDLEKSGLIEILSLINGFVSLTNKGHAIVANLRKERATR